MNNQRLGFCFALLALFAGSLAAQVTLSPLPAKIFGQPASVRSVAELANPAALAPNLVEGRELFGPQSVALDTSADPPIVYVADSGNNRVLAWRDSAGFADGARADLVLGQRSFSSTSAQDVTKQGAFTSSLFGPSSVAVDHNGNVFVSDSGNNRIVRFPKPFEHPEGEPVTADLVIGQPNLTSRNANQSASTSAAPTAETIKTNSSSTGGIQSAGLAFDREGNLWFSDSGNHRILRYPAALVSGESNTGEGGAAIAADLVLGQPDFTSASPNPGRAIPPANTPSDRLRKDSFRFGGPLAFDDAGNLFFADDLARVLVWKPPFDSSKPADRILGIYVSHDDQEPLPTVNQFNFGFKLGGSGNTILFAGGPQGLFCVGDFLFVVDTYNHRVVRFDPVSTWPEEDLANGQISPSMTAVFGQPDFNSNTANGYRFIEPANNTLSQPVAGAYAAGQVFLVDNANHRVLGYPYEAESNTIQPATHVLGQYDFPFRTPNLIEGREISSGSLPLVLGNQIATLTLGPATALHNPDNADEPPHLYIADTGNHRVLGFYDARKFKFGETADLVIGQVDLYRSIVNSPTNNPDTPNPTGLLLPASVAVDAEGNVWIADTGNGRIVRIPRPFDRWGEQQAADLAIGQPDLQTRADGTPALNRLYRPSGLAFTSDGRLVASDLAHHRVLVFEPPFTNGQDASIVLGQTDGESATPGSGLNQLNLPLGVSLDADNRIFVADANNNRVMVFDFLMTGIEGAAIRLNLNNRRVTPAGVTVDRRTGSVWVADIQSSRVLRYPDYVTLFFSAEPQWNYAFSTYGPRAITLDGSGNLLVADSANRITMHFPSHQVTNGANGFPRVAPAMIARLEAPGVRFVESEQTSGGAPLPKELADLEVTVEGTSAPILGVDGPVIRLLVPQSAPSSGAAEFLVRRVSTGEILAHNFIGMSAASPAVLFQGANPGTQGQARAVNQDGSANSPSSPAAPNQELTVYLTGYGYLDGLPEDGTAPGAETPVPGVDAFLIASQGAIRAELLSSTLDPNEPGVWRVRIKAPQVAADGNYVFAVIYRNFGSNLFASGSTVRSNPVVSIRK